MSTKTIEFSWEAWLSRADPDWQPGKTREIEYEFSARGLSIEPSGDVTEFENGQRVFRGNPRNRGAYAPDDEG